MRPSCLNPTRFAGKVAIAPARARHRRGHRHRASLPTAPMCVVDVIGGVEATARGSARPPCQELTDRDAGEAIARCGR